MIREIRDKWTAALRSGDYIQGFGSFHRVKGDITTFCALGVYYKINGYDAQITQDEYTTVLTLNDKDKKPFSEIADWIEQNVAVTE